MSLSTRKRSASRRTLLASAANGASNYESLTLTNNADGETLADSIDASTATLSSAIVGDEDAATVTYTVTLSTAPTVEKRLRSMLMVLSGRLRS